MMGMKKQKGMTLLEIIIALGIIGVVSAGVVVLAQRAIDSQNLTKATQAANTTQIAMTQTYRSLGNYPATAGRPAALTLADTLLGLGRVAQPDIINAFTGSKTPIYTFARMTEGDGKAFAIAFEGLSLSQCRQFVTSTLDMFPFIQVQNGSISTAPTGILQELEANPAAGAAIVKAPGGNSLDLTNMAHVGNLCGGEDEDGDVFTVLLGNG